MTTEIINGINVLKAGEGKDLFCTFNEENYGKECWLGNIYYDKNGVLLDTPYFLTENDFTEIDEVVREENINDNHNEENTSEE